MSETRVIKRYSNRKLYDTERSRYVTLDQIADMIRAGEDVKIVDNNSKEDLTGMTLAQIIFEEEKRKKSFLPLHAMRNIIQSGGDSISEMASQAGARVRSVLRFGDKDALAGEADLAPPQPLPGDDEAPAPGVVREFLERSQQTFDEWQKKVDDRVHKLVEALAPWTVLHKELKEVAERLLDLEKKLGSAEKNER